MGAFKWVQQFLGVYERMSVRAKEPRDYKLLMQLSLKKNALSDQKETD